MTRHGDNQRGRTLEALHAGPVRVNALAEILGVTPHRIRQIMQELEAEGLVKGCKVSVPGSPPQWEYKLSALTAGMSPERLREVATQPRAHRRSAKPAPAAERLPRPFSDEPAGANVRPRELEIAAPVMQPSEAEPAPQPPHILNKLRGRNPWPNGAPTPPTDGHAFRCALTNTGTLLLIGLLQPLAEDIPSTGIELDRAQTRTLIDYLDRMAEVTTDARP